MIRIKLFLIGIFSLLFIFSFAQNDKLDLTLVNFNIEINGNVYEVDTIITAELFQDVPTDILLYDTHFVRYGAVFTYKFKGRRVKLVRRTYAETPDGKKVYSKQKKDMQELKVSVPGVIKGKSAESILYARKTMGNIFVSFNYELSYK